MIKKILIALLALVLLLAAAVGNREHAGRIRITIGGENDASALSDFTLVTAEYSVGGLRGVIGVIGPTRMPYEKIVTIVDYTSSLVTRVVSMARTFLKPSPRLMTWNPPESVSMGPL